MEKGVVSWHPGPPSPFSNLVFNPLTNVASLLGQTLPPGDNVGGISL